MGFMDEVFSGGSAKLLKFDGRAGTYVVRGSDETFNGQEFVADIYSATGGFLKFKGKGEQPERRMGPIFPTDLAPSRGSLGDLDKSDWPTGKFGDEPEDPWCAVIEIPLRHRETGEAYTLTAQSKTALGGAKDFFGLCRRVPDGFLPVVRLDIASFQGRYGMQKKSVLTLVGKVPMERDNADDGNPFDDEVTFK